MSQDVTELTAWLTVEQLCQLGGKRLSSLRQTLGDDLHTAVSMSDEQRRAAGFTQPHIDVLNHPNQRYIDTALHWLESDPSHRIITLNAPNYPHSLRQLSRPPLLLFTRGEPSLLTSPQVAMVGSRSPDRYGQDQAFTIAKGLGNAGVVVTSGLAMGIDGWSHKGALEGTAKATVAVLGCGIDQIYPKRHCQLADRIIEQGGCIVSEFAPQVPVLANHFPRRNRIISGLSLGTVVIQAELKSGSLITARFALEQNKDVFALPGMVHHSLSQGCHYLIKQGAKLVESADDIIEEYQHRLEPLSTASPNEQKSEDECLATDPLLDTVDFEVTPIDVVAQRSGKPVTAVLSLLVEYELRGLVAAVPGGYVKLRGR